MARHTWYQKVFVLPLDEDCTEGVSDWLNVLEEFDEYVSNVQFVRLTDPPFHPGRNEADVFLVIAKGTSKEL